MLSIGSAAIQGIVADRLTEKTCRRVSDRVPFSLCSWALSLCDGLIVKRRNSFGLFFPSFAEEGQSSPTTKRFEPSIFDVRKTFEAAGLSVVSSNKHSIAIFG